MSLRAESLPGSYWRCLLVAFLYDAVARTATATTAVLVLAAPAPRDRDAGTDRAQAPLKPRVTLRIEDGGLRIED